MFQPLHQGKKRKSVQARKRIKSLILDPPESLEVNLSDEKNQEVSSLCHSPWSIVNGNRNEYQDTFILRIMTNLLSFRINLAMKIFLNTGKIRNNLHTI